MNTFIRHHILLIYIFMIWTIPWKGYALWIASKNDSKRWFIALLLLNTCAILDIIFIFCVAKKTKKELWKGLKSKV